MSQELFFRGLFSLLFSLSFAWIVFSRYDTEINEENQEGTRQKYLPYVPGNLLPLFLLMMLLLGSFLEGVHQTAHMTLSLCFGIFLHISAYYLVLLLLLPFLRKKISARACAMLWMIPNYLYITQQNFMKLPRPKLVITAPGNWVWVLFILWLFGVIAVLLWKTIEHLLFRHRVLKGAVPVSDTETLKILSEVTEDAGIKKPRFRLVRAPSVKTPLTVGLFRRTVVIILPNRGYDPEELALILRHEIVHIGREDAWSKFFLLFCTAICWFNPLMWLAMRKSAEDMELSCDETVLLDTDEATRRKYAALLLDTAGDERGFSTCLSASAEAMRHRLKSVVKPERRRSGALVVGAVFFALCMTSGYVALAYGEYRGAEVIYPSGDFSAYTLRHITKADDDFHTHYEVVDQTAFHEYLSGLTLRKLTGNYTFTDSETQFTYLLDTPEGTLGIVLSDEIIKLVPMYGDDPPASFYYISEGVDWAYLSTIIPAYPAMNVHLSEDGYGIGKDLSTQLDRLYLVENGERELIYDSGYPASGFLGVFGYEPTEASFVFSQELAAPCAVQIEFWDHKDRETVIQTDLTQPFTIPLPDHPAHYTVTASFYGEDGAIYEAEFRFEIGDV